MARFPSIGTRGGRRGRPRGRTDPPDGSPGSPEQNNGGPPRAEVPFWAISSRFRPMRDGLPSAAYRHSAPANHAASLSAVAATLACACHHMIEHT